MSCEDDDIKIVKKPYFRTLKEYATSSTTHGIAYVFEDGRLIFERVLWVIVVGIAIAIGTYWSITAYENWQENPVLTSVGTTGYSIEKVEFPSITICAQGSVKEVVDAALFKQFDEYLITKKIIFSDLTQTEITQEGHAFLNDIYPGAMVPPNQLVSMMASPMADAEKVIKNAAILNPLPTNNCEDASATNPTGKRRRKRQASEGMLNKKEHSNFRGYI